MLLLTQVLLLKLQLPKDQSQLLLKLINLSSNSTLVESSIQLHAELLLTMVSSLLDMVMMMLLTKTIGLLRTHGESLGEKKDISEFLENQHQEMLVFAVSNLNHHTPQFDYLHYLENGINLS